MTRAAFAALAFVSCFAQASQDLVIPVQVFEVTKDQPVAAHWEEYREVPSDKVADIMASAKKRGAACHEVLPDRFVLCYYAEYQPRQVGLDWSSINK